MVKETLFDMCAVGGDFVTVAWPVGGLPRGAKEDVRKLIENCPAAAAYAVVRERDWFDRAMDRLEAEKNG